MKKKNPFLIITVFLVLGLIISFFVRTVYFTPGETLVVLKPALNKHYKAPVSNAAIASEAPGDKQLHYRKNWKAFIFLSPLHKGVEFFLSSDGSITNLNVPVTNNTDYPIESITITLSYINPDNRNTIETKKFDIKNIQPHTRLTYKGPNNGIKGGGVLCEIIKIKSPLLNFCFDDAFLKDPQLTGGISGNPDDPWFCK